MYKSGECSNCTSSHIPISEYPCSNCTRAPQIDKRDHMNYKTGVPYVYDSKNDLGNNSIKY